MQILQMNKILYILIFTFLAFVSCNNSEKKIRTINLDEYTSDYGELIEKYSDTTLNNCDEVLSAGNEIVSIYYTTADKAFNENDAKAKSDLEHFDELFEIYDSIVNRYYSTCPEDFDDWEKANREKIDEIVNKVKYANTIVENDTLVWIEDVSGEIEIVNEQVEKLKSDVQGFSEEEDSVNQEIVQDTVK